MSTKNGNETEQMTGAGWVVGMLQLGDSFYPTGSYAHSFGLEGLLQAGVVHDRATLREFLRRSVLPARQQAELPLTVHAGRAGGGLERVTRAADRPACQESSGVRALGRGLAVQKLGCSEASTWCHGACRRRQADTGKSLVLSRARSQAWCPHARAFPW